MLFSRFYLGEFAMVDSWKDKRISAMNRVIKRKGRSTLDYLDEYDSVCLSKCKNKTEYKKFLDDYFKNKPSGTIENIRDDILGEDAGGYVLEEQGDIMYDMAEELYLPNEKLRRAFQDGQMSLEDFNRMYVEK